MEMRHVYKSEVGYWYWAVILVFSFITIPLLAELWIAEFLCWIIVIYMLSLSMLIRYVVDDGTLTIFSGLFLKRRIPIADIRSITLSHNPLSAPALSLRRLAIRYGKYDVALVSPKDKEDFIAALKAVNPSIETEDK